MTVVANFIAHNFVKPVFDLADVSYRAISDQFNGFGNGIQKISHRYLPESLQPVAFVVQKLFESTVLLTVYFFMPFPIRIALWAIHTVTVLTDLITKHNLLDLQTTRILCTGFGIATGIEI